MDFLRRCACTDSANNVNSYPALQHLLPGGYLYRVCDFRKEPTVRNGFHARFRVNCCTKETLKEWLAKYENISFTTFKPLESCERESRMFVYKVALKCQPHAKAENASAPNAEDSDCASTMRISVKFSERNRKWKSVDIHLNELPTIIILHHIHNHDTKVLAVKPSIPPPKAIEKPAEKSEAKRAVLEGMRIREMKNGKVVKSADSGLCSDVFRELNVEPLVETLHSLKMAGPVKMKVNGAGSPNVEIRVTEEDEVLGRIPRVGKTCGGHCCGQSSCEATAPGKKKCGCKERVVVKRTYNVWVKKTKGALGSCQTEEK